MMYKILNNSVLIDHNLEYNTNHTRGNPFKLVTLPTRINAYHDSFFPSTVTLWNNLPAEVVTSSNLRNILERVVTVIFITDYIIFLSKYVHFSSYRGCTLIKYNIIPYSLTYC